MAACSPSARIWNSCAAGLVLAAVLGSARAQRRIAEIGSNLVAAPPARRIDGTGWIETVFLNGEAIPREALRPRD